MKISDIQKHIVSNALARCEFFKFDNITRYIPNITSIFDLIESKDYLADIEIVFKGIKEDIDTLV